jgi:type III secretion system FlhB-like substrate exporter
VGETIPSSLYRAVAEVLAYIYSLKAAAGGAR